MRVCPCPELGQRLYELVAEPTADAPALQLDDLAFTGEKGPIDAEGAELVRNYGGRNTPALPVHEEVPNERGFPRSQETGDDEAYSRPGGRHDASVDETLAIASGVQAG